MTTTIFKFPLDFNPVTEPGQTRHIAVITASQTGKILSLQVQGDAVCLWIEVDVEKTASREERRFELFGTGWVIRPSEGHRRLYIGTVQINGFVWHVFELVTY
jgi:hypothetical protein